MKNRKRVLNIILVLIIIILVILSIVLILGGKKSREYSNFINKVENSTCKYAKDENITEAICEAYPSLCKVSYETLINREYLSKNLTNPLTNKKIEDDKYAYITITWNNGEVVCSYKEG